MEVPRRPGAFFGSYKRTRGRVCVRWLQISYYFCGLYPTSYTSHAPEIITETLRENGNGEFTTDYWSDWSRRGGGVGVGARLMLKMGLKYMAGFSFEIGGGHTPLPLSCYVDVILLFYALCPPVLLSAISNQLRQQVPLIQET